MRPQEPFSSSRLMCLRGTLLAAKRKAGAWSTWRPRARGQRGRWDEKDLAAPTGPATACGRKRAPRGTARSPPSAGPLPRSLPRAPVAARTRLPLIRASLRSSPGLGRSKEAVAPAPIGELVPSSFLAAVVDALDLGSPVVISPSLSGMYSLPFLTAPGSQLRGYVPVAPICTDKINAADYASVKTSTLIVYGDQDPMGLTSFEHLKQLPNHRVLVMEGAGHPCYLDKPEEWHTGLLDFLQGLA
uniref:Abhydrolase domain containing 14B n=2 Tax=Canis lupus familiaris TaxID=9615 RepID=A0A8C0MX32_CANLF